MNLFEFLFHEMGEVVYVVYPCLIVDESLEGGYFYPATVEIVRYDDYDSLGWYRGKVFDDNYYDVLGPTFEEYMKQKEDDDDAE